MSEATGSRPEDAKLTEAIELEKELSRKRGDSDILQATCASTCVWFAVGSPSYVEQKVTEHLTEHPDHQPIIVEPEPLDEVSVLRLPDGQEIPLSEVSVLRLERGDTLVLHCPHYLSQDVADGVRGELTRRLGLEERGVGVLIVDEGARLEVVRHGPETSEGEEVSIFPPVGYPVADGAEPTVRDGEPEG